MAIVMLAISVTIEEIFAAEVHRLDLNKNGSKSNINMTFFIIHI